MDFSLYYRKNRNEELFKTLEICDTQMSKTQNYIPIYEKFFSLNNSNFNTDFLSEFQKKYLAF